jgi:histidinol phosphatase-like PHP family hydrolase
MFPQDLHIHTTFSVNDNSVLPEQTVEFISKVGHARIIGISDHFENLVDGRFSAYTAEVRRFGLKLGVEVDGHPWVDEAMKYEVDYYIVHCRDIDADYRSLDRLLQAEKPVIIAHPNAFGTNLDRVPPECLIEINNRYVWRNDWRSYYESHLTRFRFVISSDAHQPNWLGQAVARYAANELGVREHLLFS